MNWTRAAKTFLVDFLTLLINLLQLWRQSGKLMILKISSKKIRSFLKTMNAPFLPRPSFLVIGSPTGNSKFRQKTFQSILSLPCPNFSPSASSNKRRTLKVQTNWDKCGSEENHSMVQSPTISRPLFHTQGHKGRKGRWTFRKVKIFHQL